MKQPDNNDDNDDDYIDIVKKDGLKLVTKNKNEFAKVKELYKTSFKDLMSKSKNRMKLSKAIDISKKIDKMNLEYEKK